VSDLKFCQGPYCHKKKTQDRIKGPKGNKTYQTRRKSNLLFNEFCSMRCYNDWFEKYGTQAVNHFGRTTHAKHLTKDNAWYKDYDWNYNSNGSSSSGWRFVNNLTNQIIPLTEEQYDDSNYTLNKGE